MLEELEDARDLAAFRRAERKRRTGAAEYVPADVVKSMAAGEHPVRVWRRHRKMSLQALARASGVKPGYLSEIETGKKPGSVRALRAAAKALKLSLDDLAAWLD
ncbi:MAG: helix-turn-helix domain-containing protein [Rhodospirillales bacterium]